MLSSSRHLIIHVDGSHVRINKNCKGHLGWGLVAQHDDTLIEKGGTVPIPIQDGLNGYHEHLAIIQGILYAQSVGISFNDVTLFCDDDLFGYGYTFLHSGNYKVRQAEHIEHRLAYLCKRCFDTQTYDLALTALMEMRMVKLKGHRQHVYQERADYLANTYANNAAGNEKDVLDFDAWLHKGMFVYGTTERKEPHHWVAPFVRNLEAMSLAETGLSSMG